ncbi:MAG TPA: sucrase ferredoxin [Gaiellaceae bacterium]|nr:sucrase ferredoxin [Gaiellaceae bacterium]
MSTPPRCADLSELAGEPLGATATNVENWLLIEVPGTWQRDVGDGAGLPEEARRVAAEWLESTPSSRLLFVRRPGRARSGGTLAFVVHAGESRADVRRFELETPGDLAATDLARGGDQTDARLVLVCGHGMRDACCALRGTAVYAALTETLGEDEVWLSSHQGGHRFAANVLVLPVGVHLGRLAPDGAVPVVVDALAGRIDLAHYRGRVAYPARVQAAELAVRSAEQLVAVDDLGLVAADDTLVRFRSHDGREHAAVVEGRIGPTVPASCGADPEPQAGFTARVVP